MVGINFVISPIPLGERNSMLFIQEKMNTAYVSSNLFHQICQNDDDKGIVDDRSSLQVANAFLHLHPPNDNDTPTIGTPLKLISRDNIDSDIEEIVHLHPLMIRVLSRLSPHRYQEDNTYDVIESNRHTVLLSSWDSDGLSTSNIDGSVVGWLEHINIINDDEIKELKNNYVDDLCDGTSGLHMEDSATIHISYICSNCSRGREFFSSKGTELLGKEGCIDILMDFLYGGPVVEGGILGMDISNNQEEEEVVFFMVNKIVMKDGSNVRFLYLRHDVNFNIIVDNMPDTTTRPMQQPKIHEDVYCPGYYSVLEEIVTLAKMDNPNGAPSAVILSGCAGVGKSRMVSWLEHKLSPINVSSVSAKDILLDEVSSSFDQSRVLDQINTQHHSGSDNDGTCLDRLLIIDDLDVIIGNSDETDSSSATISSNMESEQLRALNAVVKLVDAAVNKNDSRCFVLGIARASWAQLPLQLARVGRFEKAVTMPSPTLGQRRDIFNYWLSTLPLLNTENKESTISQWADLLAPRTAGCVAADIRRICADALASAAARSPQIKDTDVKWEDVKEAARTSCVPSQLASMDVIPASSANYLGINNDQPMDTKQEFELAWKDFGGYTAEKKQLYRTVIRPWKYHITEAAADNKQPSPASIEAALGMSKPSGVLFHGPPGVGKTMAAMCLASSMGLHCVKVRASEVFNQWLGGSEATLRSIFARARAASPCILFFDELDALATNREGGDSDVTSGVQSRILTTLLNEMDGITNAGGKQGVLVVAATNRLDAIDAALLRPGRLEEHILLSYPDSSSIHEILKLQTINMPIDKESVNLIELSDRLGKSQASCADIEGICRDACLIAMRRCGEENAQLDNLSVLGIDFDTAFRRIKRNAT